VLKRVTVRLVEEAERTQFDALLEQKHYLCSARMVGRTLRYVAELDGEWGRAGVLQRGRAAPEGSGEVAWLDATAARPSAWVRAEQ